MPSVFVRKPSTKRLAAFLLLKGMGDIPRDTPRASLLLDPFDKRARQAHRSLGEVDPVDEAQGFQILSAEELAADKL